MAATSIEVSALVAQMTENLAAIKDTIAGLDTKDHDERLDELEQKRDTLLADLKSEYEAEQEELATKRKQEEEEIAEQRRKEDEEREARRKQEDEDLKAKNEGEDTERKGKLEEETKRVQDEADEGLNHVEDQVRQMFEEGQAKLAELEEKRKEINRLIDEQMSIPLADLFPRKRAKSKAEEATGEVPAVEDTPAEEPTAEPTAEPTEEPAVEEAPAQADGDTDAAPAAEGSAEAAPDAGGDDAAANDEDAAAAPQAAAEVETSKDKVASTPNDEPGESGVNEAKAIDEVPAPAPAEAEPAGDAPAVTVERDVPQEEGGKEDMAAEEEPAAIDDVNVAAEEAVKDEEPSLSAPAVEQVSLADPLQAEVTGDKEDAADAQEDAPATKEDIIVEEEPEEGTEIAQEDVPATKEDIVVEEDASITQEDAPATKEDIVVEEDPSEINHVAGETPTTQKDNTSTDEVKVGDEAIHDTAASVTEDPAISKDISVSEEENPDNETSTLEEAPAAEGSDPANDAELSEELTADPSEITPATKDVDETRTPEPEHEKAASDESDTTPAPESATKEPAPAEDLVPPSDTEKNDDEGDIPDYYNTTSPTLEASTKDTSPVPNDDNVELSEAAANSTDGNIEAEETRDAESLVEAPVEAQNEYAVGIPANEPATGDKTAEIPPQEEEETLAEPEVHADTSVFEVVQEQPVPSIEVEKSGDDVSGESRTVAEAVDDETAPITTTSVGPVVEEGPDQAKVPTHSDAVIADDHDVSHKEVPEQSIPMDGSTVIGSSSDIEVNDTPTLVNEAGMATKGMPPEDRAPAEHDIVLSSAEDSSDDSRRRSADSGSGFSTQEDESFLGMRGGGGSNEGASLAPEIGHTAQGESRSPGENDQGPLSPKVDDEASEVAANILIEETTTSSTDYGPNVRAPDNDAENDHETHPKAIDEKSEPSAVGLPSTEDIDRDARSLHHELSSSTASDDPEAASDTAEGNLDGSHNPKAISPALEQPAFSQYDETFETRPLVHQDDFHQDWSSRWATPSYHIDPNLDSPDLVPPPLSITAPVHNGHWQSPIMHKDDFHQDWSSRWSKPAYHVDPSQESPGFLASREPSSVYETDQMSVATSNEPHKDCSSRWIGSSQEYNPAAAYNDLLQPSSEDLSPIDVPSEYGDDAERGHESSFEETRANSISNYSSPVATPRSAKLNDTPPTPLDSYQRSRPNFQLPLATPTPGWGSHRNQEPVDETNNNEEDRFNRTRPYSTAGQSDAETVASTVRGHEHLFDTDTDDSEADEASDYVGEHWQDGGAMQAPMVSPPMLSPGNQFEGFIREQTIRVVDDAQESAEPTPRAGRPMPEFASPSRSSASQGAARLSYPNREDRPQTPSVRGEGDHELDPSMFTPRDVTNVPWHARHDSVPLSLNSQSTLSSGQSSPVHQKRSSMGQSEPRIRNSWSQRSRYDSAATDYGATDSYDPFRYDSTHAKPMQATGEPTPPLVTSMHERRESAGNNNNNSPSSVFKKMRNIFESSSQQSTQSPTTRSRASSRARRSGAFSRAQDVEGDYGDGVRRKGGFLNEANADVDEQRALLNANSH